MKNRYKIILILAVAGMFSIFTFMEIITNYEPTMTLEEFQERFDGEDIVVYFKSTYPDHFVGLGKTPGMILPAWGYGSVNESTIAELRVELNFGKYEFTYTCGDIGDMYQYTKIKNPSTEDIDNNHCWKTLEDSDWNDYQR